MARIVGGAQPMVLWVRRIRLHQRRAFSYAREAGTLKEQRMDQERKIETPADDRTKMAARKSWHAPKFYVTDVIETRTGCTGGGADTPMMSS